MEKYSEKQTEVRIIVLTIFIHTSFFSLAYPENKV